MDTSAGWLVSKSNEKPLSLSLLSCLPIPLFFCLPFFLSFSLPLYHFTPFPFHDPFPLSIFLFLSLSYACVRARVYLHINMYNLCAYGNDLWYHVYTSYDKIQNASLQNQQ